MLDKNNFRTIADVFASEKVFEKFNRQLDDALIFEHFENIIPEIVLSAKAYPVSIKNGVLTIGVQDSTWRHELHFRSAEIVEKINSYFGKEIVTKVKILI